MKTLLCFVLLFSGFASAQSRNVALSWSASPSAGVLGYNVFRSASATGPFTVPLNATPQTALTYIDSTAVIGQTYTYAVTAVATPCTPTTPVGTPCGSSQPATATTTIPAQPAVTIMVVLAVP